MAISHQSLFQTLSAIQMNLRSFEEDDHSILQEDIHTFTHKVYEYVKNDFEEVKKSIRKQYSQEQICEYVNILQHNYDYICKRYSKEDSIQNEKIMSDLVELLKMFFENDILNIHEEFYYILFEHYSELRNWAKEYCNHYSIIVAHYIVSASYL